MTATSCDRAAHERQKSDERWSTLRLVGRQHIEADEFGPAITLELRDCWCGSTLSREVTS